MKAIAFLRNFTRIGVSEDRLATAEVRFLVKGVEVRVDLVQVDIADPLTWTVELGNDPATPGHVLTHDEAEVAFANASRTVEEGA